MGQGDARDTKDVGMARWSADDWGARAKSIRSLSWSAETVECPRGGNSVMSWAAARVAMTTVWA